MEESEISKKIARVEEIIETLARTQEGISSS